MIGVAGVPYIGRADHRAAVAAAFAEPGHVILVCGEAGVGKSSLVAAARAGAVTEVIEGSCLQLAGQPLPLAALEQIFFARGGWPEAADGAEQQSAEQRLKAIRAVGRRPGAGRLPDAAHARRRRPALGRRDHLRLPRLPGLHRGPPPAQPGHHHAQRRGAAGGAGPAGRAPTWPGSPGPRTSSSAARPGEECGEFVAALTGATDVDVDTWYERSQGNPYLLGELVKDPGARRVKDVLLSRVNAAGPRCRRAGPAGRGVRPLGRRRPAARRVRAARRSATRPRSARPSTSGCSSSKGADYTFRHALMCEAVLSQLLPMERRKLHERAARALAGDPGDDLVHGGRGERALGGRRQAGRGGGVEPPGRPQGPPAQRLRRVVGALPAGAAVRPAGRRRRSAGSTSSSRRPATARLAGDPADGRRPARARRCGPNRSRAPSGPARWNGWAASSGTPG